MKKKILAFTLALALALTLAACGGGNGSGNGGGSQDGGAAAPSGDVPAAGPAASAEGSGDNMTISLFAGSLPENTPTGGALAVMAEYINAYSNGTIQAEAFYDTALGDATSMVQGLQQGTVDIGVAGTAYFSGLVPEIEVFQLPFLFGDLESARTATDGPAADAINAKFESVGIKGLSFWENGFRELTNNVRPVSTPDDMSGIKMRTLPAEVQVETWKAMGALPTTIDASELYTALQQGTVAAQENPALECYSYAFYDVCPYLIKTNHTMGSDVFIFDQKYFEGLPQDIQDILVEAADEAAAWRNGIYREQEEEIFKKFQEKGVEIIEPDLNTFYPKVESFIDDYPHLRDIYDIIQKYAEA